MYAVRLTEKNMKKKHQKNRVTNPTYLTGDQLQIRGHQSNHSSGAICKDLAKDPSVISPESSKILSRTHVVKVVFCVYCVQDTIMRHRADADCTKVNNHI